MVCITDQQESKLHESLMVWRNAPGIKGNRSLLSKMQKKKVDFEGQYLWGHFHNLLRIFSSNQKFGVGNFLDLKDIPCILILVEKGRMGDTFPHSLTGMDLRLRAVTTAGLSSWWLVHDMTLLVVQQTVFCVCYSASVHISPRIWANVQISDRWKRFGKQNWIHEFYCWHVLCTWEACLPTP